MESIGKLVYERPSDEGSNRNSEGAFIDLKDGRIMYAYSHFIGGSSEDWAPSCIAACYSSDGGNTWSGEETLVTMEDDGMVNDTEDPRNILSVSLMRMGNGDVGLFYVARDGYANTELRLRRSADEGKTWGPYVCATPAFGYNVVANDRVLKLSDGRLLAPVSYARIKRAKGPFDLWNTLDGYLDGHFYASDDDGATWFQLPGKCLLSEPVSTTGLQEPMLIELPGGLLWMLARTDLGRQYESFSRDRGASWTAPQASAFTSACSPIMIKHVPGRPGCLAAVWNPIPWTFSREFVQKKQPQMYMKRSPLVVAISRDHGATWEDFKVIMGSAPDSTDFYEYPALHMTQDSLLIGFDGTGTKNRHLSMFIHKVAFSELGL